MKISPLLVVTALLIGAAAWPIVADEDSAPAAATVKKAGKDIWEDTKAVGRAVRDSKTGRAVTEAGKDIGHEAAEVGKKVGDASVELGQDTAEVSKDVWHRGSKASVRAAKAVRNATVAFWHDVTREREDEAARLRKENAELKAKADGE